MTATATGPTPIARTRIARTPDADRTTAEGDRPAAVRADDETADRPNTEYEQGREDERVEEERTRRT